MEFVIVHFAIYFIRVNMVSFYIVRHGQTLLNCLDRAQGWADLPLTDAGKQTAVELGHKLKGIDFNAVYTSDMLRAVQTAFFSLEPDLLF